MFPENAGNDNGYFNEFMLCTRYKLYTSNDKCLTKKIVTNYSNNSSLSITEDYRYDSKKQIIEKLINNSNGNITTTFNYPYNFAGIAVYDNMVVKNMIAEPIEIKKVNTTLNNKILDWQYNNYQFGNGNTPVLKWIDKYNSSKNQFETEITYDKYDNKANILQITAKSSPTKSYLWDANGTNPIAEATNAKQNEIFHDNFESLAGWDYQLTSLDNTKFKTGKHSGRIDNPYPWEKVTLNNNWLNISLSAPKKYKYSVWVYSTASSAEIFLFMKRANETGYFSYVNSQYTSATNHWVLVEGEFNVPQDVTQLSIRLDNNGSGTVWFDDVRLHPADAQMTTYTYEPLIGMSSQTDANIQPMFYYYDAFNRLSLVKDKNGNVLKRICYNYQGQQEVCYSAPPVVPPPPPPTIYARLTYENYWNSWPYAFGDIVVRLYSDAAGTIPVNANNLQMNCQVLDTYGNLQNNYSPIINGNSIVLEYGAFLSENYYDYWSDTWYSYDYTYSLTPGNYVIIP